MTFFHGLAFHGLPPLERLPVIILTRTVFLTNVFNSDLVWIEPLESPVECKKRDFLLPALLQMLVGEC